MIIRSLRSILILLVLLPAFTWPADTPILGFLDENVPAQREREHQLDQLIDTDDLEEWMRYLTSAPHHVGSPHTKANAEYVAKHFESWGYDTEIEVFHVLFPTPKERIVELVGPTQYRARLEEPALEEDASSQKRENVLPPFNAYSADGDVTAELVYVNYGIPEDYEELARRGIDVEGKVVIARYGRSWRGIKPKVAAEHGALACILYSDPRDDGYGQGDVYPEGPYRNKFGAQRGSVSDMPQYPGDPLTPGVGAKEDTERMSIAESPTIMKIPVLPISYSDAQPLLAALGGPVAPGSWRGGLPITYHMGPGPAMVRVKLEFSWDIVPAYNVIARIEGSEYPDEWIMRGNHRDAWVFGAADPSSGTVAMMAEAKAIGELMKSGWRPKRTILYGSWDAEEPGLLGSTEWAEYHGDELKEKLAVYINTDGNGRGFIGAGGSHALERMVNEVIREVTDPQTGVSVDARRRALARARGSDALASQTFLPLSPLGSGSDYTPFLQHLGIASLNIGYGGENGGGAYHSLYDTFEHYTRFGDPGFVYGKALAQTAGRMTLRLAQADVLPWAYQNLSKHIGNYLNEIEQLETSMRKETVAHNARVEAGVFELAADPRLNLVPPEAKDEVPHLNLTMLKNAVEMLNRETSAFDKALAKSVASLPAEARQQVNGFILQSERLLTHEDGLPNRPWFKHHLYAPGFYTGYGVKTMPGVREAIESREWALAEAKANDTAMVIMRLAESLAHARVSYLMD